MPQSLRLARLLLALIFLCPASAAAQQLDSYDVFTFTTPRSSPSSKWRAEKTPTYISFKRENGALYCDTYLFRPRPSTVSHQADFAADWQSHAAKHGVARPEAQNSSQQDSWQITSGAGQATLNKQPFAIIVSTRTANNTTYAVVHYFNDQACTEPIAAFMKSINVVGTPPSTPSQPVNLPPSATLAPSANPAMLMTKFNTNFDDGWVSTVTPNYVQVKKAESELRLHYVNDALDKSRPNTVEPEQFYWSQIAEPNFRSSQLQKWVQVTYPPIYFLEGNAVDKRSGKNCYVALKVIYAGGARVILSISPTQAAFRQAFPHPNDLDRMLTYNKFAVGAKDLPGTWAANSGGGVQYYNAYTGNYAGMQASSSTDEFVFNPDGTYKSIHRNASTTSGSTNFSGIDYQGRFSVSDWEILATNRVQGKTKKFWARLEAIQNGYLLILTDSDYEPLQYILYRRR